LREAATVPLILAFYCVLGGDQELPERRADLYPLVIDCLLTGRWRGRHDDQDFDPEACLRLLREWAWSAASSDEGSGIGAWRDAFSTEPLLSLGNRRALDHVAVAIKPGVPKGEPATPRSMHRTTRRFVHRTIQEHLVAEYVAALPADQAAGELFGHLWYDPDWEYAAPTGLILHPHRDEVLTHLMGRLTSRDFSGGLAAFDGCREIRRFLAKVARESAETDWSPQAAAVITLARYELIDSPDVEWVSASGWRRGSSVLADGLLDRLEAELGNARTHDLDMIVRALIRVGITPEQRDRFRALVGKCLAMAEDVVVSLLFGFLAAVFSALEPSARERATVRGLLLERLASAPYVELMVPEGVSVPLGLAWTVDEQMEFAGELTGLLPRVDNHCTGQVVDVILQLDPNPGRRRQLREILMTRLRLVTMSDVTDAWSVVAKLDPTADDRACMVRGLLDILVGSEWIYRPADVDQALDMLAATPEERARAHAALLATISSESSGRITYREYELAQAVAELEGADETACARVRGALVSRLAGSGSSFSARRIAEGLRLLKMPSGQTQLVLTGVAVALASETDPVRAQMLAEAGIMLCPERADIGEATRYEWFRHQALEAALRRCEQWLQDPGEVARPARQREFGTIGLADDLRRLAVTLEERARAHGAALAMFSHEDSHDQGTLNFVGALTELAATADERVNTRRALIRNLASGTESWAVQAIMDSLFQLGITDSEQVELRAILIRMFAQMPHRSEAKSVAREIIRLKPTLDDLRGSAEWPCKPTDDLLAAVRSNTPFHSWLAALPEITTG